MAAGAVAPAPDPRAQPAAAGLPPDIVDYSHWNAHSIFFLDPGGNVVEYIARHDLKNGAPGAFSSRDILGTSEIALIVDDVPATVTHLRSALALERIAAAALSSPPSVTRQVSCW